MKKHQRQALRALPGWSISNDGGRHARLVHAETGTALPISRGTRDPDQVAWLAVRQARQALRAREG